MMMNSILHPYIRKFLVVYIHDIIIFSKTEAEHQAHVRLVLKVLKREKFFVCKAKSSFAQTEIKYLGHIVDKRGTHCGFVLIPGKSRPSRRGQCLRMCTMFVLF
jgi:hypothetical protein